MTVRTLVAAGLVVLSMLAPVYSSAQGTPSVEQLLPRVATYINQFVVDFSNVVAEESYTQEITTPRRKRVLKSDFMLVKFPGADQWVMFRDTFEVDGKSVRAEPERLSRLFLEPPDDAFRRGREITSASEKYNLMNIGTLNMPLLVMALMQEELQPRFRFTLGNIEKSMGPDVRVVQFREFVLPTIMKRGGSDDMPANGLLWVEQATGRIRKTQLIIGRRGQGIDITVTFDRDAELGIDVPVSLSEFYPDGNNDILGKATYSRFRRFAVTTDEQLQQ